MERCIFDVVGPGHHERSEYASLAVAAIAGAGFKVAVEADLRPRLAADLSAMLRVGAVEVLLHAESMVAKVVLAPKTVTREYLEPLHDEDIDVVIRLIPADSPVRIRINKTYHSERDLIIEDALIRADLLIEKNS